MKRILLVSLFLLLATVGVFAGPLVVTPTTNANTLANTLNTDPNITIVNATLLQYSSNQQGTFTGGMGLLPFDSGILLTSGSVYNAPGPNNSGHAGASTGSGSTSYFNNSYDANVLQIVFTTVSPDISFQYVFGSEEYNEFVGSSYNDAFGFFLDGVNIAKVNGIDVAINNVNCGTNSAFYRSNESASGCTAAQVNLLNLQYDGLAGGLGSLPLYVNATVSTGVQHTIDLVITDRNDSIYDSGVFLHGFVNQPAPPVPEPGSVSLLVAGLIGLAVTLRKRLQK